MREISNLWIERIVWVLLATLLVVATGCKKQPQRSPLMTAGGSPLTVTQLRIATHVFVDRFAGMVEEAADEIIAATEDREIRQNARLWKINALSAGQRAGFQDDPLAGYLDLWILSEQMAQFFEDGPGKDLFGPHQPIAVNASRQLVTEAWDFAREVSGRDHVDTNDLIDSWVDENPIENLAFGRTSTRTLVLKLLKQQGRGAFAAIGSLDEGVSDLADRSTIYAEYIPKLAMWQVEYLFDEIMQREDIAGTVESMDDLAGALKGVDTTADELMMLLDVGIAETLPAEREILTKFIDEQRVATLAIVRSERIAVLEDVAREREIVLAAVTAERIAVMNEVESMRIKTINDLEGIIEVDLDSSWKRIEGIIDKVFLRFVVLVGALVVVMIIFGFAALRTIKTLAS